MNASQKPVVVGVSDKQPAAIKYALVEAARQRATLRVVHCYVLPAQAAEFYLGGDLVDSLRMSGESVLEDAHKVVDELAHEDAPPVEYDLRHGAPGTTLLEAATGALALVVGADDVPWFDRMLGGEVASYLARRAECPVIVVPEVSYPVAPTGGVVVTIDGDTSAAGPLRYGFEQADVRGESLHVLHAAPAATAPEDFDNHRANVAEIVAGWAESFPSVRVLSSITSGDPTEACVEATRRASLVVIGRPHARSVPFALARPVAVKVLRGAQCPVAIVPSDYRGI